jgi:hypothetical protein
VEAGHDDSFGIEPISPEKYVKFFRQHHLRLWHIPDGGRALKAAHGLFAGHSRCMTEIIARQLISSFPRKREPRASGPRRSPLAAALVSPKMAVQNRCRRAHRRADDRGSRRVEHQGQARFFVGAGTSVMAAGLFRGPIPVCVSGDRHLDATFSGYGRCEFMGLGAGSRQAEPSSKDRQKFPAIGGISLLVCALSN